MFGPGYDAGRRRSPQIERLWLTHALALCLVLLGAARAGAQTRPITTVHLTPGWATFGQAVPQGLAHDGLQVGHLFTQTDVKNRWPDGTIRFAIVTARVPAPGTYAVAPASAASGAFGPVLPSASVALVLGGVTYTAALPGALPDDSWLSGPLAYEGRFVVPPISAASGAEHPFLRVNFDTRLYNDGAGRLDVSVENVLDAAGAATVAYDATIRINGQPVFTKNSVQHYYLSRWRKVFAIGSTSFASITPDMTAFNTAKAVPPYLPLVSNVVNTPSGPSFDILQSGALRPNMSSEGARPELAPYPDWAARYLVHRDVTQRSFVLANGDLSGSWPIHLREPEISSTIGVGAERLVSIEQRPAIWLDDRAQGGGWDSIQGSPLPVRETDTPTPGPGQSPLIPDNAHQPSIAFVPYLLTGDRYYAEEMAFWANYGMLRTDPGDGLRSSQGILAANQVRGYGWALRNLVDAASYYPDASPIKAYLSRKVTSNLQWLDAYAGAQSPITNPFQILWPNRRSEGGQYIALWEQSYLAHAIDRANQHGFAGGLAHRDAIARLQLRLFTSDPDYPRAQAAPFLLAVGTANASDPSRLDAFHSSVSQMWAATAGQERPFAGAYGPEARLNLIPGLSGAWPGAQAAYDYLWPFIGVHQTWGDLSDLAERAGWAIAFPDDGSGESLPALTANGDLIVAAADPIAALSVVPTATLSGSPATIVWGQSTTLTWNTTNATSVWIDQGIGFVAAAGTRTVSPLASMTYTLTATGDTGSVTATTRVTVRTAPAITWAPPANLTYGTPLGAAQLNATTGVSGTWVYTPAAGTVLPSGAGQTLSVTFLPADTANYITATATVPVTVLKAKPVISWAPPGSLVFGTALGPVQLNATVSSPPGTLVYTPATGTILPVAPAQRLSVTFTPADTANYAPATAAVPITVVSAGSTPAAPVKIGNLIAGTFGDATGHSAQSHLVYAPNAGRWWLFTLSSAHDALGNRTVQSYVSSGPDLAIATWTAAAVSPTLGNAGGATSSRLAGGRSLGVAVRTIGTTDYVHVFASAAYDGQTSSNGHIRAQIGPTSLSWGAWNNPGSPNSASEWQGPLGTGNSSSAIETPWGNSVGISSGGFIHHFSVTMDQEVDCNIGRSTNADTAAAWTNGFGNNVSPTGNAGTSPPWTTAVIDKTMTFECKVLAFAPLASDVMLAVYSNGAVAQPNLTNLRFQRSGASGTWTNIPVNGGGQGNVFSTTATINQNDWALVPMSQTTIQAFRKNGTAVNGASYATATNTWTAMAGALAPPAFTAGQAFKAGGGLFGATDGTSVWLFVVNTDAANSILYTRFSGGSWTAWATVPGTGTGTQTRNFISGYRTPNGGQVGLAWTQGTTNFDVMATALNTAGSGPSATATVIAPATGSTVSGDVTVTATATPGSGTVAGVQFVLDGANLGAEDTSSPYSISWSTATAPNGAHFLSAIARDTGGGTGVAPTVTVNVLNDFAAPTVAMIAPASGSTVAGTSVFVSASATDDVGVIGVQFLLDGAPLGAEVITAPYTISWNPATVPAGVHTLAARARDAAGRLATSAPVSVTKPMVTPTITWPGPANIVYGTAIGPQLNATASVPGTFVYVPPAGTVLPAGVNRTLSTTFTPADTTNYTTATASVVITVIDTTPPTLTVPPNAILEATSPAGAVYVFSASASDPVDGSLAVSCVPSGSTFPLGTTTVTCTTTDSSGLTAAAAFAVMVRDTTPPSVTPPASISVAATEYSGARGNVAGSLGSQRLSTFITGGSGADVGDAAPVRLAPQAVVNGSLSDVTTDTLFPAGATTVVFRFQDASGNLGSASSVVTVTARVVDEPTVIGAVAMGGNRLEALQNPDGGWSFRVGGAGCAGTWGTCPNTFGVIGLGLLATDRRTGGTVMREAAIAAGNALVARYEAAIAQTPKQLPFNQDIEFLIELAALTGDSVYATTALSWFQVAIDQFPNAAARIDDFVARRNPSRLRSVAAWDAASFIRAAKAAGHLDYALAAAIRTRALEPIWKDTNPAHRSDQCADPSGCGPADNPLAFKYTILGEGSLLWAIHDLPGFDAQVGEYRAFLLAQQDPAGSWDGGDSQITSYVTIGLAAVGGAGTEAAITSATNFFLANQLPSGGWPFSVLSAGEYGAVNAEVVRAMSTLFSTPAGTNVAVAPAQLSNVTFSTVSTSGMTTVVAVDQATAPVVTAGFDVVGGLTYQVATTAAVSGDIVVCFSVPWITDAATFAAVRILHAESAVLVDRTVLAPDQPAPDFDARRVCARTSSLSPFAVALARPDTTPPVVTVPADVTISKAAATYSFSASATDAVDGSVTPICTPASGTTFSTGITTVMCRATDDSGNTGSATFTVTVTPARNRKPVALPAQYRIKPNAVLAGFLKARDADGDRLTFQLVANESKGKVVVNALTGAFTYTPSRRTEKRGTFTFRVTDGTHWSRAATISVTIAKEDEDRDRDRRSR